MKALLLSQYYPPESGSSAMRMSELAEYLAQCGHDVHVVTGFPNYPSGVIYDGYQGKMWQREHVKGVQITRTFLLPTTERHSFRARLLNYLSFMLTSIPGGLLVSRPDVIYFYSPPLFLGVSAWILSRFHGVLSVVEVNDLWPEAPIALGVLRNAGLISVARWLERFVYDKADHIFLYSRRMREALLEKGVAKEQTEIWPLWVDTSFFSSRSSGDVQKVRDEYQFGDRFVVMYAGNIGLAQGMDTVIDAARLLRHRLDIAFVLVGEGVETATLMERAESEQLGNVMFVPQQPLAEISDFLSAADVLLAHLDPAPHRLGTIPAKILAYMSVGRPVLLAAEGEAADVIERSGAGLVVQPRSPEALVAGVLQMQADPGTRALQGQRGRQYAVEHFERSSLLARLEQRLLRIAGGPAHSRLAEPAG